MDVYLDGFVRKRHGIKCILCSVGIGLIIYYVQSSLLLLVLLLVIVSITIEIGLAILLILNTDRLLLNLINASLIAAEVR